MTGDRTMNLGRDLERFLEAKANWADHARQTAALYLLCGIDMADALASKAEERERLTARIRRLIERERMRGVNRHWTYDLNRHIALKQALDRLNGKGAVLQPASAI
jgi:hypothetical protein